MQVSQIIEILSAEVLCGEAHMSKEIDAAFGSDMMSDVLAFATENTLLLTGLINTHVVRTAEMLDVRCIVFVRGKPVPQEIIEQADKLGIVMLATKHTLYVACGILYAQGLPGCVRR